MRRCFRDHIEVTSPVNKWPRPSAKLQWSSCTPVPMRVFVSDPCVQYTWKLPHVIMVVKLKDYEVFFFFFFFVSEPLIPSGQIKRYLPLSAPLNITSPLSEVPSLFISAIASSCWGRCQPGTIRSASRWSYGLGWWCPCCRHCAWWQPAQPGEKNNTDISLQFHTTPTGYSDVNWRFRVISRVPILTQTLQLKQFP